VTELDFDELDRAVNSLISGAPAGAPKESTENVLTLQETPATGSSSAPVDPSAIASPVVAPVDPSTPAVEDPLVAAVPTLATKRSSGRFMDVVHPSSDMRNTTSTSSFNRPNPVSPLPVSVPERTDTTPTGSTDMPDPLDFSASAPAQTNPQTTAVPTSSESTDSEDDDIDKIANDITNSLKPEIAAESEPALTSPFLPDAKVDKRPLGAFSDDTSSIASEMSAALSSTPTAVAVEVAESPTPEPVVPPVVDQPEVKNDDSKVDDTQIPEESAPLPEELQSDLLSIESTTATNTGAVETAPVEAPASIQAATSVPTPEVTVGPTAITQQYKEEPSTGDKQSGAIFDTESYHKPLAQPAKKKKSPKLVPLIAGVIVVGAGIGAVVYYFVLPLL